MAISICHFKKNFLKNSIKLRKGKSKTKWFYCFFYVFGYQRVEIYKKFSIFDKFLAIYEQK